MRTHIHTTLLPLLPVLCLALVANMALAQQQAETTPPRNVITDGTQPAPVASKGAPAAAQTTTNAVTLDDGTVMQLNEQVLATYNAKPTLSAEETATATPDAKAMEAWILKFVQWRADHPDFYQVLTPAEREAVFGNGDLRRLYVQKQQAAYHSGRRDQVRQTNGQ